MTVKDSLEGRGNTSWFVKDDSRLHLIDEGFHFSNEHSNVRIIALHVSIHEAALIGQTIWNSLYSYTPILLMAFLRTGKTKCKAKNCKQFPNWNWRPNSELKLNSKWRFSCHCPVCKYTGSSVDWLNYSPDTLYGFFV